MTRVLRHIRWQVLPDPARQPPIRYVQCRVCDAQSTVAASQAEGDLWAMHHSGRTSHREYREFAASNLVTRPTSREEKP